MLAVGAGRASRKPELDPFVVGGEFDNAVWMVIVLPLASIPLAAAIVLAAALVATDEPGEVTPAELVALAVTIPALIVFIPGTGGLGAAFICLIAYSLRLAVQLRSASRAFHTPWSSFLRPTADDIMWLRRRLLRLRLLSA